MSVNQVRCKRDDNPLAIREGGDYCICPLGVCLGKGLYKAANGEWLPRGAAGTTVVNDGRPI